MTDLGPALTLGQMVDRAVARLPDRVAVVFKRERISYGDLKRRADDFARGLLALGLGPGDHIVLWMPNRVEWNVANLGIAKIGAVTVTCNSRYKVRSSLTARLPSTTTTEPDARMQQDHDGSEAEAAPSGSVSQPSS